MVRCTVGEANGIVTDEHEHEHEAGIATDEHEHGIMTIRAWR